VNTLAEFMISGDWLVAALLALIPVIGGVWIKAKKAGAKEAGEVTLKEPVPEVPVKRVYTPPTFSQHQDVVRRVAQLEADAKENREHFEQQLRDIRREQAEQFVKLMQAGEMRKDMIFEKIDSMARGFHARVDQIMDDKKHPRRTT